jgi:hypothetical protein
MGVLADGRGGIENTLNINPAPLEVRARRAAVLQFDSGQAAGRCVSEFDETRGLCQESAGFRVLSVYVP